MMNSRQYLESLNGWLHRLKLGSLFGVVAYTVNYGIIWLLLAINGVKKIDVSHSVTAYPRFVGQILYNAHFVGSKYSGDAGRVHIDNILNSPDLQRSLTNTIITSPIPKIGYHLVPILVLVLAGYVLYQYAGRPSSRYEAAVLGLGLIPGYLFLSVVGIKFFVLSGVFVGSRPDPLRGKLMAGILYPAIWGMTGTIIGCERQLD